MKEIGGYLELDEFIDNEYYKDLIRLNTGRNALIYIIKAKKIKKLYIPYYLCNSISNVLVEYRIDFEYYNIDKKFNPLLNKTIDKDEYVYIVNYFGQLSNTRIQYFKEQYKNIIVDNTQAFFQKPIDGIDTIYSCRKFFGVPDGAYLSTDKFLAEKLEIDISKDRVKHILGRYEGRASDYYNYFQENDKNLKNEPLKYMSMLTRNILKAIDYTKVRDIRKKNYFYLDEKLKRINKLKVLEPDVPFAYPLYLENGMEIKKELIEEKIYIPTLWANVLDNVKPESIEYKYILNILPIPCDQRCGENEMEYIVNKIIGRVKNV